jgi:hypothetical protein
MLKVNNRPIGENSPNLVTLAGLPDFFGPKYQNGVNYTKLPQNVPKGSEIFPMAVK